MKPPDDVEATWDLDGLQVRLPGAGLGWFEALRSILAVGGSTGALLVAMVLYEASQGRGSPSVLLLLLFALAPMTLVGGFVGLGALRASGTPIRIRIEPDGQIQHTWLGEPTQRAAAGVRSVEVLTHPPRVAVDHDEPWVWRVRSDAQATWLAAQLEIVAARNRKSSDGRPRWR